MALELDLISKIYVVRAMILDVKGEAVFVQRTDKGDNYAGGFWEFPGGVRQEFEEELGTVTREVWEETALKPMVLFRLTQLEMRPSEGRFRNKEFDIRTHLASHIEGQEVVLSNEHTDWVKQGTRNPLGLKLTRETRHALNVYHRMTDPFIFVKFS